MEGGQEEQAAIAAGETWGMNGLKPDCFAANAAATGLAACCDIRYCSVKEPNADEVSVTGVSGDASSLPGEEASASAS